MCTTSLWCLICFTKNNVRTISALVMWAILGELKFWKNLKRQIILHVFIQNLYPTMNTFMKLMKIKGIYMCTIAHEFLQVRQERCMCNFRSLVKWQKCTYDFIALTRRCMVAYMKVCVKNVSNYFCSLWVLVCNIHLALKDNDEIWNVPYSKYYCSLL